MLQMLCICGGLAVQSAVRFLTRFLTSIRLFSSLMNDILSATVLELTESSISPVALMPIIIHTQVYICLLLL